MIEPIARARASSGEGLRQTALVFAAYTLIAAVATWPLLRDMRTMIVSDPGDALLNTAILLWNATTMPLSAAWWNAPHYYPAEGMVALTENLLGMSPIASPIYWLTGNPLLAHNLPIFLTWPISAFAVYLLVRFLCKREDAAFLAGLAFGFSPYRVVALGHLQTLATFGVPLAALGMHGYLEQRRWPWLVLAGLAWLQQAFANGYYVVYGGLFIALWWLYFCTRRDTFKPGLVIGGALAVFSLPLVPMLVGYRAIHEQYGLHRTYNEILYFSANTRSWFETQPDVWLWHFIFPFGKDNMFPGLTAIAIAGAGIGWLLVRRDPQAAINTKPGIQLVLGAGVVLSLAAIAASLRYGIIDTTLFGLRFRMTTVDRAVAALFAFGVPLVALTPRTRNALQQRSPLVFYAAATIVVALLSCGPVLRAGEDVIWDPAPYGWLMSLPGFNELRVPTQLKMIDIMCLAVAAGLAYRAIRPSRIKAATIAGVLLGGAILLDGWMLQASMAVAPERWAEVEPADRSEPILELPLGPDIDFAATFRAAWHHRRMLNGVSGYDPPHYNALRAGLAAHDPSVLIAIASLGAFDIVVDGERDPDGTHARYAAAAPGAARILNDGHRTLFRVPKGPAPPPLGPALPIAAVRAIRNDADSPLMHDGKIETGWGDYPQKPDASVTIDLGTTRDVAGVTNTIGEFLLDFPRRLAIDVSVDGETWTPAWEGPAFAQTFLAYVREPRRAALEFAFEPHAARYVRLRQLESFASMWRISELTVHSPR